MMKRANAPTNNPALPRTPVVIAGKTYDLCFDFAALGRAENEINAELARAGIAERVNLLYALPVANLRNTQLVFAAAVRTFHPDLSFAEALALLTFDNLWDVAEKIREAWKTAVPEADKKPVPTAPGK
ncbi:hypothetical protein [Occallatibacter riparius]|uniref:Tail assembly chaperone n=1 Tax=Occallatibacter riparius TaxID=1002689 RepID=A0A9J7BP47_9BACT|nr:hypothetical protein [Occallatibacter riparius]UWZ84652.1 hypothetical protein MOP44_01655 [Occallatibacter riparius]